MITIHKIHKESPDHRSEGTTQGLNTAQMELFEKWKPHRSHSVTRCSPCLYSHKLRGLPSSLETNSNMMTMITVYHVAGSKRRTHNVRSGTRVPNAGGLIVAFDPAEPCQSFICIYLPPGERIRCITKMFSPF